MESMPAASRRSPGEKLAAPGSVPQLLEAFQTATGLGVRFALNGGRSAVWACENPFCRLLRLRFPVFAPCVDMRAQAREVFRRQPVLRRCPAGLAHVSLPVVTPDGVTGWLESGQVFDTPPRKESLSALGRRLTDSPHALAGLERAFLATPFVSRTRLQAGMHLLPMLARELGPALRVERPIGSPGSGDTVERVKRVISRELTNPIRLKELAAEIGVSPPYLSRLFRRQTGKTLTEYVADARVERAKVLLARGGTITDVAFAAGFQSIRQFNSSFKACTRQTPSEYRSIRGESSQVG
jgi:AraC-like DNA-binding protein/ligand-binding sensor protein